MPPTRTCTIGHAEWRYRLENGFQGVAEWTVTYIVEQAGQPCRSEIALAYGRDCLLLVVSVPALDLPHESSASFLDGANNSQDMLKSAVAGPRKDEVGKSKLSDAAHALQERRIE
jgi:hypothetical protein